MIGTVEKWWRKTGIEWNFCFSQVSKNGAQVNIMWLAVTSTKPQKLRDWLLIEHRYDEKAVENRQEVRLTEV